MDAPVIAAKLLKRGRDDEYGDRINNDEPSTTKTTWKQEASDQTVTMSVAYAQIVNSALNS